MPFEHHPFQDMLTPFINDGGVHLLNPSLTALDFLLLDDIDAYLTPFHPKTDKQDIISDSNNDYSEHQEAFAASIDFDDIATVTEKSGKPHELPARQPLMRSSVHRRSLQFNIIGRPRNRKMDQPLVVSIAAGRDQHVAVRHGRRIVDSPMGRSVRCRHGRTSVSASLLGQWLASFNDEEIEIGHS